MKTIEAQLAVFETEGPLAGCLVLDDIEGERWHRGVVGILASRVVDRTGRPALVLTPEDGEAHGKPVPAFLWQDRGVVPYLKVDKGLEKEADGVSLMKPIPGLDALLARAKGLGVFGTKMRSVVNLPHQAGIAAIVKQQFEIGRQISDAGLMPILEPEVLIKSPDKAGAEAILLAELSRALDTLPEGEQVMLKVTIPEVPDLYAPLIAHKGVARLVALSGGYPLTEACEHLRVNHGMIASFSRALVEGLTRDMSDDAFDARLGQSIDEIFRASVEKH